MKPLFLVGVSLVLAAGGLLGACSGSSGPGEDGSSVTCTTDAQCGANAECSAGKCVALTACTSDAGCVADSGDGSDSSGGADGSGGAASSGGSSGTEPALELIDDLEDGDAKILPNPVRVGFWYSYNEETPRPRVLPASIVADGGSTVLRATGSHKGGVASDSAYGGLGVDLNNSDPNQEGPRADSRVAYDASAWDGFQFRIKSPSTKSIRFEIVTTAVATGEEGGSCGGDNCFDAFGLDVALNADWTTVQVPFSAVVQEGWGQSKTFDPKAILGLAFEDLNTGSWDFSIDDLSFYEAGEAAPPSEPGDPGNPGGGDPTCSGSWGDEPNGSITWYTFNQGTAAIGDVNCSYGISQNPDKVNHVATGNGTFFGAINTTDYDTAAACGACVEVSRNNGKKVVVTVVDQCPVATNPKCVKGHIDLSKAAFLELGLESEGYLGQRAGNGTISWKYVPCATTAKVSFRLKEPANTYWNMILVQDHVYPIASVQVKIGDAWLNASRSEFNFWLPPGGKMGSSPYTVRATDVNGAVLEGSVSLTAGNQSSGKQFVCE